MITDFRIRLLSAIILFSPLQMYCQSIPIQLMVVDQNGFEIPNTQVKLRLTMRGDTSLTTGQYQEVHNVSTNDLGVVSVDLGEGIVTTNSQVLDIDLFNFDNNEPYIKTELDTSISPTNYANLGWIRYHYPMIARRALWADSSRYSDTANYITNEKIGWYKDSSEINELQSLHYNKATQTLSIAERNSVQISTKNEYFGEVGELIPISIPDSVDYFPYWSFSVASNTRFFGWTQDTLLISASFESPWLIDTVVSPFRIRNIYPSDSIIIGISKDGLKLIKANMTLTDIDSISLGGNYSLINIAYKDDLISAYVANSTSGSATRQLKIWNLNLGTISSGQSMGYGVSYSMTHIGGYRQDNSNIYLLDRFSGQTKRVIQFAGPVYYDQFDTTFSYVIGQFGYGSSYGNSFTIKDSTGSDVGGISFGGGTNISAKALSLDGSVLYHITKNANGYDDDYTSYSYLILINPNVITQNGTASKIYLRNFDRSHPETSYNLYVTRGETDFVLILSNCKNVFVDGGFINGSFIYKVPYY